MTQRVFLLAGMIGTTIGENVYVSASPGASLEELNALLAEGWRVRDGLATRASVAAGGEASGRPFVCVFVLEREEPTG